MNREESDHWERDRHDPKRVWDTRDNGGPVPPPTSGTTGSRDWDARQGGSGSPPYMTRRGGGGDLDAPPPSSSNIGPGIRVREEYRERERDGNGSAAAAAAATANVGGGHTPNFSRGAAAGSGGGGRSDTPGSISGGSRADGPSRPNSRGANHNQGAIGYEQRSYHQHRAGNQPPLGEERDRHFTREGFEGRPAKRQRNDMDVDVVDTVERVEDEGGKMPVQDRGTLRFQTSADSQEEQEEEDDQDEQMES